MVKNYRAYNLKNYRMLPQVRSLPRDYQEAIEVVGQVLPFKTNNYVVEELIDWNRPLEDPVFVLNFPQRDMLEPVNYQLIRRLLLQKAERTELFQAVSRIRQELNPNPAGQAHNVPRWKGELLRGIQHKYRETVLFFPAQGQTCHAYCSFCFRWSQFSGMKGWKFAMKESNLLAEYIGGHPEVTDVLFTGGDPMVLTARLLASYIEPLLKLEHLQTIRIGTKSLSYWPYRYLSDPDSEELLRLFEKITATGKNLSVQAHFSHPVELSTYAVQEAIRRIRNTGAQIRTQSPLLKHINDDPALWAEMWRKQVNLNCIPYYMFVARDTGARHYFEVPLETCWQIFRQAYQQVSGVCRTVRGPSMSCDWGKVQLLGVQEFQGEKVYVLRFLQGRRPEWVGIPFFAAYDPEATWFDQLKPAGTETNFFFERE